MRRDGDVSQHPSATIITTLSHAELLPTLRSVLKGQEDTLPGLGDVKSRMKSALEHISISRVFDFDGLREALDELDRPIDAGQPQAQAGGQMAAEEYDEAREEPHTASRRHAEPEIRDSEDEDEASSLSSPASIQQPPSTNLPRDDKLHHSPSPRPIQPQPQRRATAPDIVLITNLTVLITSLYTSRDRKHAHRMLRHLSSRLRYLSRSPSHGGPLFILLNSTTSKSSSSQNPRGTLNSVRQAASNHHPSSAPSTPRSQSSTTTIPSSHSLPHSPSNTQLPPPDQLTSLHPGGTEDSHSAILSLFNPPPPDPVEERGEVDEYGYARHPNPDFALLSRLSRRNKPFFGLRFDGLVDVHLLATRVPKTDGDAEVYFAGSGADGGTGNVVVGEDGVGLVWVVEVLSDRLGIWVEDPEGEVEKLGMDWGGKGEGRIGRRFSREQRWAGVEVREEGCGGVTVVDVSR